MAWLRGKPQVYCIHPREVMETAISNDKAQRLGMDCRHLLPEIYGNTAVKGERMNATGKRARAIQGGNRYTIKRNRRRAKRDGTVVNSTVSPEQYRAIKRQKKDALQKRREAA